MNRQHWVRIAALPLALVLATAGCGSSTPAATKKRLGDQGPCDLAKLEDLEKVFGSAKHPPEHEGPQCFYSFENGHLAVGRAADAARNGTLAEVDGVTAKKFEKDSLCVYDVWLVPGDINQQFHVSGDKTDTPSCDVNIEVARLILNSLPG